MMISDSANTLCLSLTCIKHVKINVIILDNWNGVRASPFKCYVRYLIVLYFQRSHTSLPSFICFDFLLHFHDLSLDNRNGLLSRLSFSVWNFAPLSSVLTVTFKIFRPPQYHAGDFPPQLAVSKGHHHGTESYKQRGGEVGHGQQPFSVVSSIVVVIRHRGDLQRPADHKERHKRHDHIGCFTLSGHVFVQLPVGPSRLSPCGHSSDVFRQGVERGQIGANHQHQRQHLIKCQRGGGEGRALLVGGELPDAAEQRPCGAADHHQLHGGVAVDMSGIHQRWDRKDQVPPPHQPQDDPNPPPLPLLREGSKAHVLTSQGGAVEHAERQCHPTTHRPPPHPQQHEDSTPARRQGHIQAQVWHKDGHRAEKWGQQVGQRQVHQDSVRGGESPRGTLNGWLKHLRVETRKNENKPSPETFSSVNSIICSP